MSLVRIDPAHENVDLDLAYATGANFTGAPIYARAVAYLHADALAAMRRAVTLAGELALRLRVFDAFRPSEAQWKLWQHTPDPTFVADPRRGSPHGRGVAIDLTLIDAEGQALDMGTAFDDFTPLSYHGASGLSPEARRNRLLLLGLMTAAGWDFYEKEWWHYQLFNARRYPLWSDSAVKPGLMA